MDKKNNKYFVKKKFEIPLNFKQIFGLKIFPSDVEKEIPSKIMLSIVT